MSAITDKINRIISSEKSFSKGVSKADDQLYREILNIYGKFVSGGTLVTDLNELAKLEDLILKAIKKTTFGSSISTYMASFDEVNEYNTLIQNKENGLKVANFIKNNDNLNNFVERVSTTLRGRPTGIIKQGGESIKYKNNSLSTLTEPIADIIREDVLRGVSFDEATKRIKESLDKGNIGLKRYAANYARDALSTADGITQNELRIEYDLNAIRYSGSIKDTSRPVCRFIKSVRKGEDAKGGGEYPRNSTVMIYQLDSILNEYIPNGEPSKAKSTVGPTDKSKKGDGMIPGTVTDNFMINRGGYGCRHSAIPIRVNEPVREKSNDAKLSFDGVEKKLGKQDIEELVTIRSKGGTEQNYIGEFQGFNKNPKLINQETYDKLVKDENYIQINRGIAGVDSAKFADQFKKGKLYGGKGIYGNGSYFGNLDTAESYAGDNGNIIKGVFDKRKMNIIDYEDARERFKVERKNVFDRSAEIFVEMKEEGISKAAKDKLQKELATLQTIYADEGSWATAKGYDAIFVDARGSRRGDYHVILNRSKLTLLE